MWYVIQVRTGSEDNIRLQCEKNISPNILKDCFIPYYEERRHLKGEWRTLKKILFPGCPDFRGNHRKFQSDRYVRSSCRKRGLYQEN